MTAIPVTDADREAAAKAVEMGEAWLPLLFAKTRAEGAASEREALEAECHAQRKLRNGEEWAIDLEHNSAVYMCIAAIRARGEGGAK